MSPSLTGCQVCPRKCGADRFRNRGVCQGGLLPRVSRAGLHLWEEPCISGERGSGTVFFSGCSLQCVFCQNHSISQGGQGKEITADRLAAIFDELTRQGAHNINLVNVSHYAEQLEAVFAGGYRKKIPFVYNSSGYDCVDTLKRLEGIIDVYLPDLKYCDNTLALRYSGVSDYAQQAEAALQEMYRQKGNLVIGDQGLAETGVLIRHLILPGQVQDSFRVIDRIESMFSNRAFLSLMSQYVPCGKAALFPEINRKLTTYEYDKVCSYCSEKGFSNVYIQEAGAASEKYIPKFDFSGV